MKKNLILFDAHVHIHECFEIENVLDSALDNFRKACSKMGKHSHFEGVLLLTETAEMNKYLQLRDYVRASNTKRASEKGSKWNLYFTEESTCLRATRDNKQNIFIIAGRQVITEEHLEVLALATDHNFADGTPLRELIRQISENDGIPVIPWGAGKWWGKRGEFLRRFIIQNKDSTFFLGDNGGRDPLPLTREVKRPGSFGFMLLNTLNVSKPSFHLRQILRDNNTMLINYGNLQNPIRFFMNQISIRLNRLIKR